MQVKHYVEEEPEQVLQEESQGSQVWLFSKLQAEKVEGHSEKHWKLWKNLG